MRIWIVAGEYPTPERPIAGPFVRDQVEALRALGHDVTVVHHDPPTLRRAAATLRCCLRRAQPARTGAASPPRSQNPAASRPLRSRLRWAHDSLGRAWAEWLMRRDFARLAAQQGRPDVVHAHDVFPAGSATSDWAGRSDVPYVVTIHAASFLRAEYISDELLRAHAVLDAAAAVIAVSAAGRTGIPLKSSRIDVLGNVVQVDRFRLRDRGAQERGPVVSIGALQPGKDMAGVIRAWTLLPDAVRELHPLHIVGAGPEEANLRALAAGLAPAVTFHGHVLPDQLAELLRGTSLLVSASRVETFGVTLIEALAAGVPFVATRSGGPDDIWTPVAGLMVELDHTDQELSDAMAAALADADLQSRDDMRRADAVARFSGTAIGSALESLYHRVLSR